ncbi:MAG: hypothetical protein IJ722_00360 [Alloprevotella sp.]|nr:hypothetical protein [Alloprevotella sp.]
MHIELRRRLSAWMLLAAFVPMLLLSSLHRHADWGGSVCAECVQHQPHTGHLTQALGGVDDCLLCHFFSLSYLPVAVCALVLAGVPFVVSFRRLRVLTPQCIVGPVTLRGPPVLA